MRARSLASLGALFATALACATPGLGQTPPALSGDPVLARNSAQTAEPVKAATKAAAGSASKRRVASRPKPIGKRAVKAGRPASSGLLALAGCYGRFIGWRDELSALMLQSNSYTPWPMDRVRFDRIEHAFAASAKRDRNLVLTLQPTFKETDFPADVRSAFRAGFKTASNRFAEAGYRQGQVQVLGEPALTPAARMSQLEVNADQVFAPLAAACERRHAP